MKTYDVKSARYESGKGSKRKFCLFVVALLAAGFLWLCYMPVHFYRPYCDPRGANFELEYFSPDLSEVYRESLRFALRNTNVLHLEIGDRFLVPILSTGEFPSEPNGKTAFSERAFSVLYYIIFGRTTDTWSNTNTKVALSAIGHYSRNYPETPLARMKKRYSDAQFGTNMDGLDYDQIQRLRCDQIRVVADVSLDDAKSD